MMHVNLDLQNTVRMVFSQENAAWFWNVVHDELNMASCQTDTQKHTPEMI